jgi:Protein of unknown function (DUF2892)
MKQNLGTWDRILRVGASATMATCAVMAPLPFAARLAIFGGLGTYMMLTALAGTCLGYRMMGKSTCPVKGA